MGDAEAVRKVRTVLLGLAVACSNPEKERQRRAEDTNLQMMALELQISAFELAYKRLPERLEDLRTRPDYIPEDRWRAHTFPSITDDPLKDAWGRSFGYRPVGEQEYELWSLGADGREGGDGADQDLRARSGK